MDHVFHTRANLHARSHIADMKTISICRTIMQCVLLITSRDWVLFKTRDGRSWHSTTFANNTAGRKALIHTLNATGTSSLSVLIDIVEEELRVEILPALTRRDRNTLVKKKCRRMFNNTSHWHYRWQGRTADGQAIALCTALGNSTLLDQLLHTLRDGGTALRGISSPALLAETLPMSRAMQARAVLVVGLHTSGLRITLLVNGMLKASRLTEIQKEKEDIPTLCKQIEKMIQYLLGQRLIIADNPLVVWVSGSKGFAEQVAASYLEQRLLPCQFAATLSGEGDRCYPEATRVEHWYVSWLASHPVNHYARRQDTASYRALRTRRWVNGTGLGLSFASAVYTGYLMMAGLFLAKQSDVIEERIPRYTHLIDEARITMPQLPHSAEALRDDMERLAAWRRVSLSTADILQFLSKVLNKHDDIQLMSLQWSQTNENRGYTVVLDATLSSFDGNYQKALTTIKGFVHALEQDPMSRVVQFLREPFSGNLDTVLRGNTNDSAHVPLSFRLSIAL